MNTPPSRILTVDDEEHIRSSIRRYLEDYNYIVWEAANGKDAVEQLQKEAPDLILLDLRMPEMTGFEFLDYVREQSYDIPVIVVSGTGTLRDAVDSIRLGAWDYILKPINDMHILKHRIEKALERVRLLDENEKYRENLEELVNIQTNELLRKNQELEETRLQIIRRLGRAAEYKDNETGKHVIRVSLYSEFLARKIGLDGDSIELIRLTSPMHDLGKIGIPDKILLKAESLDRDEWQIMETHAEKGSKMLEPLDEEELKLYHRHVSIGADILGESNSPLLEMARRIAIAHHEHWDGSGYPMGLKGEEIPIEARIVSIADVYDALSSKRSYKEAYPEERCQDFIRKESGKLFDPDIVKIFFANIDKIVKIKSQWQDQEHLDLVENS